MPLLSLRYFNVCADSRTDWPVWLTIRIMHVACAILSVIGYLDQSVRKSCVYCCAAKVLVSSTAMHTVPVAEKKRIAMMRIWAEALLRTSSLLSRPHHSDYQQQKLQQNTIKTHNCKFTFPLLKFYYAFNFIMGWVSPRNHFGSAEPIRLRFSVVVGSRPPLKKALGHRRPGFPRVPITGTRLQFHHTWSWKWFPGQLTPETVLTFSVSAEGLHMVCHM